MKPNGYQNLIVLVVLCLIKQTSAQSYYQPKLSPVAMWDSNATTLVNQTILTGQPHDIFIDLNDTIYITVPSANQTLIWLNGSQNVSKIISNGLGSPQAIFVNTDETIYIDNGQYYKTVDQWQWNSTSGISAMNINSSCYGLFIDQNNSIYCSLLKEHRVTKVLLNDNSSIPISVAGNGSPGSSPWQLNLPRGIFVAMNFSLYIADCKNNRVQLFHPGQPNGTTIFSNETLVGGKGLDQPFDVTLDADGYLFIVDLGNSRIIASGPNGFRCVVGCSSQNGSQVYQLNLPQALSFDSQGNLLVLDSGNSRLQKFNLVSNRTVGISYNQPEFCSNATWNRTAITFADSSIIGNSVWGAFVDINNSVYVLSRGLDQIQIWNQPSVFPTRNISLTSRAHQTNIFVTNNGDIYIDTSNANSMYEVQKWTLNATQPVLVMYISERCSGLFVDIYDSIYCTLENSNQVVKRSFGDDPNNIISIAGDGSAGSTSYQLSSPYGIFVTVELNLYVADCNNSRIQLFLSGQKNATTVAGNGAPGTINLNCPIAIVLDAHGNLFITDSNNHRIVGSTKGEYRCIAACEGGPGSASTQLDQPTALSFDRYGNLFVVDMNNNRIQKFFLEKNGCISYNQPQFSSCATWNSTAITFANATSVGESPTDLFVTTNNSLFVTASFLNSTRLWLYGNNTLALSIPTALSLPYSVFVTSNYDIYVYSSDDTTHQVDRWTMNETKWNTVMSVNSTCFSVFVAINDDIYCSMPQQHEVIKRLFNDSIDRTTVIAGNGTAGAAPNMLSSPRGIFVTTTLQLYVADCNNNRVQLFQFDNGNATTVASNETGSLNCPTDIALDFDGNLFIADSNNNRIVFVGPHGSRCIVGCTGTNGSSANELYLPQSLTFDRKGNLFVNDYGNNRIQQFILINPCALPPVSHTSSKPISTIMTDETTWTSTHWTLPRSSIWSTVSQQMVFQKSSVFVPLICPNSTTMGLYCNTSASVCDALQPCQNSGTCQQTNNSASSYNCLCLPGVEGAQCQYDRRPCQSDTCWNNGTCNQTSTTTFICQCQPGWTGVHCQTTVNYCENVTCENRGVCRSLLLNYTCDCLGDAFSGAHCEIVATKTIVYQRVSKSFATVAIIALMIVFIFIVTMDILKYVFGVDPARLEREQMRSKKLIKRPRTVVVQRFVYVNRPPTPPA